MEKTKLNLSLFGEEGGQEGGQAQEPENTEYGKQAEQPGKETETTVIADSEQARRQEFERLIKEEYKDLYDERAQKMIDARFKQVRTLEEQAEKTKELEPVLEMLAQKYGVDSTDAQALARAIEEDDSYYEEEALEKGLTVEQLKHMKQIERENAAFKRAAQEQQRRENADRIYAQWQQQASECQRFYPQFDLAGECAADTGERFLDLLKNGIDVRTAYEVIHKDELLSGAMALTAHTIQEKTVNDIRARGMRPAENGGSGSSAARIVKKDPSTFTRKDREEIARRVLRGERIEL